jgi:hypothetical protein
MISPKSGKSVSDFKNNSLNNIDTSDTVNENVKDVIKINPADKIIF